MDWTRTWTVLPAGGAAELFGSSPTASGGIELPDVQHVHQRTPPTCSSTLQMADQPEDVQLIKPRKLQNPVKSSRSHQELHRELLNRRGCTEMKPELQRVLESRKREQLIRQRKQEDDAHRKISPLEAELRKRHHKLEELQRQEEEQQQEKLRAPEFIKVKENLRRTSICKEEEMV